MQISFSTDKGLTTAVGSFSELSSEAYLKSLAPRALKRLKYAIKQIIGTVYQKRAELVQQIASSEQ